MSSILVTTAAGRRLRHPKTGKVLPGAADSPFAVDPADPHWYRALQRGDLVEVKAAAAAAPAASPPSKQEA